MKKYLITIALTLLSFNSFAKRGPVPVVKPLIKNGTEYDFRFADQECKPNAPCGMQVYLFSKNKKSNKINWETQLYQVQYRQNLELDVQSILPSRLQLKNKNQIVVIDEMGSTYKVDSKTGKLIEPLKSIVYPYSRKEM